MSRRDNVGQDFYDSFRNRGGFKSNSARDRKRLYEVMFTRVISELAINRFKWEMPKEIDTRFVETWLMRQGLVVFFKDNDFDKYFALRGAASGKWNMYDNPIAFTVTGSSMLSKSLSAKDCVPIWCNALRVPEWDFIMLYATKMAELEITIETNIKGMRTPVLFAVGDNERLSFANLWRQMQEGEPAIFGTETLLGQDDLEKKIKKFDIGVDKDQVLNLQIVKSKMWNELMTLLGIDNANQDKRERLVADEVSANNQQMSAIRNASLNARNLACDLINDKFGLDVSVKWNDDNDFGLPDDGGLSSSVTDPKWNSDVSSSGTI